MKWTEKCILNLAHHNLFENDGHRHRFYDLLDCYFDKPFFTKGLCKCMYLSAWDTEHFSMMLETLNATLIEHDFRLHLMRDQGQIEQAEALILSANTAGFLDETVIGRLRDAAGLPCMAADGSIHPLLGEDELACITVQRGTLTAEERSIIESHVSYTAKLLSKVEFRGDYKPVPKWASCHHELLDGSGYPEHL